MCQIFISKGNANFGIWEWFRSCCLIKSQHCNMKEELLFIHWLHAFRVKITHHLKATDVFFQLFTKMCHCFIAAVSRKQVLTGAPIFGAYGLKYFQHPPHFCLLLGHSLLLQGHSLLHSPLLQGHSLLLRQLLPSLSLVKPIARLLSLAVGFCFVGFCFDRHHGNG